MRVGADEVLPVRRTVSGHSGWRFALPATAVAIVLVLTIYWRTAESIVAIWMRSETFAHGFLIVPIALVLVWMKRGELATLTPAPDALGFALLAVAGLGWLVAEAGQVQVLRQYAMVAMIPATVMAVAGRHVARAVAFPLAFLLFGVPVGEALIPPLMHWTADFTVTGLELSGIPVFREGLLFTIPSGRWSVVEGCSGLRYLIASITVGTLYAYLNYKRHWKRALFISLSVAVPVLANGLRAYMIVMIAHLSDMKLALGIDHLIYGWVFFGLVMLLLFWLGSFWRDAPSEAAREPLAVKSMIRLSTAGIATAVVGAVALASAWPLYALHLERAQAERRAPLLAAPAGVSGWSLDAAPLTTWRPHYIGASSSVFEVYRRGDRVVALYIGYYRNQRQDAELVNSRNVMVLQKHAVWASTGESSRTEDFGTGPVGIRQTRLRAAGQRLLIWDWFRISGHNLSNPYLAKALLARDKLLARGDDSAAIIVTAPYDARPEAAEETLREFVREMLPSIDATLVAAKGSEIQ